MKRLLNRIKNKIAKSLYFYVCRLVLPFKSNRLLIVRLDAIGDYILFRNCIHYLKEEGPYKDYKFTLLGNKSFKSIAIELDSNVFDEFIWIDPEIVCKGYSIKKFFLSFKLILKGFDLIMNPVHSRIHSIDEFIFHVGAKKRVGSKGDDANYPDKDLWVYSKKYYHELIEVPYINVFELFRNEKFIQKFNQTPDKPLTFSINTSFFKNRSKGITDVLKVLLFPGAGAELRRWSCQSFAELINLLSKSIQSPVIFIIAGSKNDKVLAEKIKVLSSSSCTIDDVTGKTELIDLIELIHNSDILISNETSAVHIAAAVNTTTICISNGNHFGRFNPYPKNISEKIITVYPDLNIYNPEYFEFNVEKFKYTSDLDINLIDPKRICELVLGLLGFKTNGHTELHC